MADDYKTVKKQAHDEFVEKRSRFIGYCTPVTTEEEATDFIAHIRAKHWDARHNVYAYSLREGNTKRYSDDGEPSGTAGMPVLAACSSERAAWCAPILRRQRSVWTPRRSSSWSAASAVRYAAPTPATARSPR